MRRGATTAIAIALSLAPLSARAQRATDVGAQPAKREITKMPRLVRPSDPVYPASKRDAGTEEVVVLAILLAADGAVTRVDVVGSPDPDLAAAAVDAAKRLVFEPAEVDGRPAPAKITYRYTFARGDAPAASAVPPLAAPAAKRPAAEAPVPAPAAPPPSAPTDVRIAGRPRARREIVETRISAAEGKKVAGARGDVLKVVHDLPGVSRPPLASGQLVVWGSAPQETRTTIDGVEIPALYHGAALRAVVTTDLVATVDLVPGAFGAEYGRGLGGLVRVETRELPKKTHAYVGVDTLDSHAMVGTTLGSNVRFAVAGRAGHVHALAPLVAGPEVLENYPIPRYHDGQLKVSLDLRRGEALDLVALGSSDDLSRVVPSPDPASVRRETTHAGFSRVYLRYTRVGDDTTTLVTPFVGRDTNRLEQAFGATPARLELDTIRYGVRASRRVRVGASFAYTVGLDALGSASDVVREGSLGLPAREGDPSVFGQPPAGDVARDDFSTHVLDVAPNAHADLRFGPLTVTPGARFDLYLIEGSRRTPRLAATPAIGFSRLETALDPRLSARLAVGPDLAFFAAYGQYHQPPAAEDLSAVFGTPDLALARATHLAFGESHRLAAGTSLEVTGFAKSLSDLVVRSRLPNPLLARALTQNGEGRSLGLQVLLRQEVWRGFFGWVSYTMSRSERRNEGDPSFRRFDFDQPHLLTVVASQSVGRASFGARFRYGSGNPRTPIVDVGYDARDDRYDPVFGARGSIRLPAFWQLDVRADYTFDVGRETKLVLYADVQNVTNRENAEDYVYDARYRERGVLRGLPTLAVLGARIER